MTMLTGADVVELRRRRGWSVNDLADILGVEEREVRLLETNDSSYLTNLEPALLLLGAVPGMGGQSTTDDEPLMSVEEQTAISEYTADPSMTDDQQMSTPDLMEALRESIARARASREEPSGYMTPDGPVTFDPRQSNARRISNSEVQTFKDCRRKWWLAWYRGLTPRVESPVGVKQVGNRIHRAMEIAYEIGGPYHDRLLPALEMYIQRDRDAVGDLDEVTKKQFEDEANLERIMLEGYLQWLEETGADANLEVIAVEEYVETSLPIKTHDGREVKIIGRLDVRVRRKSDGVRQFIDHKTVDAFTTRLVLLPLDEQSRHYQLLEWMTSPVGQRSEGVIFNMLRRVKRTPRATPPFYMRESITHNRITMENYYDRLLSEVGEILVVEQQLDNGISHQVAAYPRPDTTCSWKCQFVKVCSMFDDGSRVEDALSAHYEVKDPLSYYDRDQEGVNT